MLPIELFLVVATFLDRRRDLLAFALTCHGLYDILVPDWVDLIEVESSFPFDDVWLQFLERPFLCEVVRSLRLIDTRVIRPIDPALSGENVLRLRLHDILRPDRPLPRPVYEVLPNLKSLKRFQGSFKRSVQSWVTLLAECFARSGCSLEELDLDFAMDSRIQYRQFPTNRKLTSFLSVRHDFSVLSKLSITTNYYDGAETDNLIDVLTRIPNLTHFFLCPPNDKDEIAYLLQGLFTKSNWSKLKHVTINKIDKVPMEEYRSALCDFLRRHPKLETFYFDNLFGQGCVPLDTDLSLKAIHIHTPNPETITPIHIRDIIPIHIAKHLTHLSLEGSCDRKLDLNVEENSLPSLRTCSLPGIVSHSQLAWLAQFVKAAPNLEKCDGYLNLPLDLEFISQIIEIFSSLKKLTHLLNVFFKLFISGELGTTILTDFCRIPALSYINVMVFGEGPRLIRILRDGLTQSFVGYESVPWESAADEMDYKSWGNFFQSEFSKNYY